MAHQNPHRTSETTIVTGTGVMTLLGAESGAQALSAEFVNTDTGTFAMEPTDSNNAGLWMVFRGTYGTGGTITVDTVLRSSSGTSQISWGAGTKRVYVLDENGRDVQSFTTTAGTNWTKPLWARFAYACAIAPGGGGGAGRRGASGTLRTGGGGGGGGGISDKVFDAAILGATELVTIGSPGTGGAAQTVDDNNGASGTAGGNASFGSWLQSTGGAGGVGGTNTTAAGGAGGLGSFTGGAGVQANSAPVVPTRPLGMAPGGGPAGAQMSTSDTPGNARPGTVGTGMTDDGPAGAGGGNNGTNGVSRAATDTRGGTSGSSGRGTSGASLGYSGGDGGTPGGGGAGGTGSANGNNSGKGGDGGAGRVIIITW